MNKCEIYEKDIVGLKTKLRKSKDELMLFKNSQKGIDSAKSEK